MISKDLQRIVSITRSSVNQYMVLGLFSGAVNRRWGVGNRRQFSVQNIHEAMLIKALFAAGLSSHDIRSMAETFQGRNLSIEDGLAVVMDRVSLVFVVEDELQMVLRNVEWGVVRDVRIIEWRIVDDTLQID